MRLPRETYQIQPTIETHLPHLSQPQLAGLAPWVCGAILAGSACQNAVASVLSPWLSRNNLRQYLREWLYDGSDRARPCKTQLDVTLCFALLLRWVLTWWRSGRLAPVSSTGQALAVDPTLKGDQTTAIVISVLYRGCAIPVAWSIRRATQPGSWMDPTVELLKELAPAVPREMTVIILTDLPPQEVGPSWYALRFWIEMGFKACPRPRPGGPSRAWAGSGTKPGAPTRRASPAAGWRCRWRRSWPWPTAPELAPGHDRGVEDAHDRRIAPGNLRTPPNACPVLDTGALSARHRNSWQKTKRKVSVIRHGID